VWKYKLRLKAMEYFGPFITSLVGLLVAFIAYALTGFNFLILETVNLLILSISGLIGVVQWNKMDKKRYLEPKTSFKLPVDPEDDKEIVDKRVSEDSYRFFIQLAQIHFVYSIFFYLVQKI